MYLSGHAMNSLRSGAPVLNQSAPAEYVNIELRLHRKLVWCLALSILLHGLLVLLIPKREIVAGMPAMAAGSQPLVVQLNAVRTSPTEAVPPSAPAVKTTTPPASVPAPERRIIASAVPSPESFVVPIQPPEPTPTPPVVIPPPPTPVLPAPAPAASPTVDFATALAQRRAARGASPDGTSAEASGGGDPATAAIARNVATLNPNYGNTGGVFQILHKGHRAAQFAFNGWKSTGGNKWRQVIDVDAGQGGDVERAIVQKMIELIREHYQGDFTWESHRLRRVVTLSAAPHNNDALVAFLMREFFG